MQIHGAADLTPVTDATTVATLYSSATASTSRPAVTLRSVGSAGGQAAAFTYDLARSIVATRQGNIAWAGQKRDGQINPIRSDDLFFPDWLDFSKVRIPQADEQQRLLANLITQMNLDRTPLPRFWYLPRGEKAAVVLTGDDHGHAGTIGQFNRYQAGEPGRLLGRRLAVRAVDVVRLSRHGHHRRPGAGLPGRRLRDRPAPEHRLRRLHAGLARGRLGRRSSPSSATTTPACPRRGPAERTASPGATGPASRRSSSATASASTPTTTTGPGRGCRTAPACSPGRASRCASPTRTAR